MRENFVKKIVIYLFFYLVSALNGYTSISIPSLVGVKDPERYSLFVNINRMGIPTARKNSFLLEEVAIHLKKAYLDFHKLYPDIPFIIISAERNYNHQAQIWNGKWDHIYQKLKDPQKTALAILKYSSMPGTSRHHWGTDFDITSLDNKYFESQSGQILYEWMKHHMAHYGFCQPYTANRSKGYKEERWHWSYKRIASIYTKNYKDALVFNKDYLLKYLNFKGSKQIPLVKYIQEYVFSINSDCL